MQATLKHIINFEINIIYKSLFDKLQKFVFTVSNSNKIPNLFFINMKIKIITILELLCRSEKGYSHIYVLAVTSFPNG